MPMRRAVVEEDRDYGTIMHARANNKVIFSFSFLVQVRYGTVEYCRVECAWFQMRVDQTGTGR